MATITYTDAVNTLRGMFAHMDENVIRMVLDSNRGHMERTVEGLLQMSAATANATVAVPNEPTDPQPSADPSIHEPPSASPAEPSSDEHQPPSSQESPAVEHVEEKKQASKTNGVSDALRVFDRLPDDFLRPPLYYQAPNRDQITQDALLANMLQDRLFMRDLRQNPESFMDPEQEGEETNWREKMSQLGASAREKLAQIAAKFDKKREEPQPALRVQFPAMSPGVSSLESEDSALLTRSPDPDFIEDPLLDGDREEEEEEGESRGLTDRRFAQSAGQQRQQSSQVNGGRNVELQVL